MEGAGRWGEEGLRGGGGARQRPFKVPRAGACARAAAVRGGRVPLTVGSLRRGGSPSRGNAPLRASCARCEATAVPSWCAASPALLPRSLRQRGRPRYRVFQPYLNRIFFDFHKLLKIWGLILA